MKAVGIICDITPIIEKKLKLPKPPTYTPDVITPDGKIVGTATTEILKYVEKMKERKEKIKKIINEIFYIPITAWHIRTSEIIDQFIICCVVNKIPYILQTYDGVTDEEWVKKRLWEAASIHFRAHIVKEAVCRIGYNAELLTTFSIETDPEGNIIGKKEKELLECVFFLPDNEEISISLKEEK
jgi:hypothetical protein